MACANWEERGGFSRKKFKIRSRLMEVASGSVRHEAYFRIERPSPRWSSSLRAFPPTKWPKPAAASKRRSTLVHSTEASLAHSSGWRVIPDRSSLRHREQSRLRTFERSSSGGFLIAFLNGYASSRLRMKPSVKSDCAAFRTESSICSTHG